MHYFRHAFYEAHCLSRRRWVFNAQAHTALILSNSFHYASKVITLFRAIQNKIVENN